MLCSKVIQLTMPRTRLLCPDIDYPWQNPKSDNECLQNLCLQFFKNLSWRWDSFSPKSKWARIGYFCCCVALTHNKAGVCTSYRGNCYKNILKPECFQRHTVFVRQVCHLYLAITSATPWWILLIQINIRILVFLVFLQFDLVLNRNQIWPMCRKKSWYPMILYQTSYWITWSRDLEFPFPTIVVHESPFSSMEQNTISKEGWNNKTPPWSVTKY